MRLKCEYKTDKLPIAYHMFFVSLLKEAFKRENEDYFNSLYKYKGKKNKKSKNFSFSVYMKDFKKEKDCFLINGKVNLTISTPDYNLGLILYNGLQEIKDFSYKNEYSLKKIKIEPLYEKTIFDSNVIFKTLSPICIKDKNNQFLDVNDPNYIKGLNYIADLILINYRGYGLKKELEFDYNPENFKKVVVKQNIKKFTEQTGKKYYYVNSYKGIFELNGNTEDLNDLYKLGLGFKRNEGFGLLEVL